MQGPACFEFTHNTLRDQMAATVTSEKCPTGASLFIINFQSLDQEEVYKNAEKKTVHGVIKNLPFSIELRMRGEHDPYQVDFHKFSIRSVLLYDSMGEEKPVPYVKSSPIDWVVQVNETGERAKLDFRLHVLSSQHEDMFFRLKIIAVPPKDSNFLPIHVISDPIRCVSKQTQLTKNKKSTKRPKRSYNDTIMESLVRIESQQKQQQMLINSLFQAVALLQGNNNKPNTLCPPKQEIQQPPLKRQRTSLPTPPSNPISNPEATTTTPAFQFEKHLHGLIETYQQLAAEQRAETISNVIRNDVNRATEVIDALWIEGRHKEALSGEEPPVKQGYEPYNPSLGSTPAEADLSDLDSVVQRLLVPGEGDYISDFLLL